MVRELRELSLTVARCGASIEMPDVVRARDGLIRRYVKVATPPAPRQVAGRRPGTFVDDVDDLPVYWC
jgi:hypothetical protein